MEIAFFFGGITNTASDQSISRNSCQSGSLAIAASTSSSVRASTRAQSVLPLRWSPHFRVTVLPFFIFPRAPRRDDSDNICSPREDDGDELAIQGTQGDPALLVVAVRLANKKWTIEDCGRVLKIYAVLDEVEVALLLVPLERCRT